MESFTCISDWVIFVFDVVVQVINNIGLVWFGPLGPRENWYLKQDRNSINKIYWTYRLTNVGYSVQISIWWKSLKSCYKMIFRHAVKLQLINKLCHVILCTKPSSFQLHETFNILPTVRYLRAWGSLEQSWKPQYERISFCLFLNSGRRLLITKVRTNISVSIRYIAELDACFSKR